MLNPTNIKLTLEQTAQHQVLHLVRVGYSYDLTHPGPSGQAADAPFVGTIDILGDDLIHDDLLATAVDAHEFDCAPGDTVTIERSFLVGQSLLDEDIGDDEIKVTIKISREGVEVGQAMSPIVRGRF